MFSCDDDVVVVAGLLSVTISFSVPTVAIEPYAEFGGGDRLRSHSFMKSDAVFFRLLGVSRFSIDSDRSSRLAVPGGFREERLSLAFDLLWLAVWSLVSRCVLHSGQASSQL